VAEPTRPLLTDKEGIIKAFSADPWWAHKMLFPFRMEQDEADFHKDICTDFWRGPIWRQILGFRGCAKSTIGESNIVLQAGLHTHRNLLIVGSSVTRAAERLAVVSYQIMHNQAFRLVFGETCVPGTPWTTTKLVLDPSGYTIQAMGRDQDIRGLKHRDWRPDFVFVDDFEDAETVRTPEARRRTLQWFVGELLPACEPDARVLVNGTVLDEESVPMQLWKRDGWPTRVIPVEYIEEDGTHRASWPARFPMRWIEERKASYTRLGQLYTWNAEYMMVARSAETQTFATEQFRYDAPERSWHAVYAMIDPARTTGRESATTGFAIFSWINHRLVVWAAGAKVMAPDEIVDLCFTIQEHYNCTWLGIEPDGLEQFLIQPIRRESLRRGVTLPLQTPRATQAMRRAGRSNKTDFIRGLQPFFAAREVVFNGQQPELEAQLLSFPSGKIDAPNALAYALILRPGAPVYDGFSDDCIAQTIEPEPSRALYIAANAAAGVVTAALVQWLDGGLFVYADWVVEGTPEEAVATIAAEAALLSEARPTAAGPSRDWTEALKLPEARTVWTRDIRWVTPPHHQDRWNNVGLNQAIRRIPAALSTGANEGDGRREIGDLLKGNAGGGSDLRISRAAVWTLRALAGGYSRMVDRSGRVMDHAEEGPYRTLMEGIESFAGIIARRPQDDIEVNNQQQPVLYDKRGRAYASAMPER
jgi:hypothetical protein